MKTVVQRVKSAAVTVDGVEISKIGRGFVVLLGVGVNDREQDARYLADRIMHLRVFEDAEGKMNLPISRVKGSILIVSQFTLYGDCLHGRRPSFTRAAGPEKGRELYECFVDFLTRHYGCNRIKTGVFGAKMTVQIENDGPVTFILEKSE
jgi:D-tyrosyl-tRNA(Tyr) deacylase